MSCKSLTEVLRTALLGFVFLAVPLPSAGAGDRLVAIADIHGAYDSFVDILQEAQLIDDNLDWIGGDAALVQTGDFLDRGAKTREVMDLLMGLQEQAKAAGGEVIVLIGNHEAMNILGFRRDVNPESYEAFATEASEERLSESFETYKQWLVQRAKENRTERPRFDSGSLDRFREMFPAGFLEYRDALGPEGRYGKWLRSLPMAVKVGDTVLLHGGIPPSLADWSLKRINGKAAEELSRFDACVDMLAMDGVIHPTSDPSEIVREGQAEIGRLEKRLEKAAKLPEQEANSLRAKLNILGGCVNFTEWFLLREESPVWFRGFARWTEEEGAQHVERVLRGLGAQQFVVGHTTQRTGSVVSRFQNRVFLIDTGMLHEVYEGRPSALEIQGNQVRAIYPDETVQLAAPPPTYDQIGSDTLPWLDADGKVLPFRDEDALLEYLETAEIVDRERTEKGVNRPMRVTLSKGGVALDAVFRQVDVTKNRQRMASGQFIMKFKDSFRFEVAAYWVSRLLEIDRVPPAVLRRVDGTLGSMQLWLHNVVDEEARREKGLQPPDTVYWTEQKSMQYLFDALIYNFDRNQGNLLIDRDTFTVWLIDHTRSFLENKDLPEDAKVNRCDRRTWQLLKELDRDEVMTKLDPALQTYELEALFARWDAVVARIQERIEEFGEEVVLIEIKRPGA